MNDEMTALAEAVGVLETPDQWWWVRDLAIGLTLAVGAYAMLLFAGLAEMGGAW